MDRLSGEDLLLALVTSKVNVVARWWFEDHVSWE